MSSAVLVVVTLVLYQGLLLGIGFWARRRSHTQQGYFIGDRKLGPWLAALSYAAGSSSAWSILGVSGIAFSQGLSAVWIIPGTLSGHLLVWFFIAPKLQRLSHQHNWLTLTDLVASQLQPAYARWVYRLSALVILFCFTFYIAAQFQGAAHTFTATFAINFNSALLIGVLVVLAYTLWGGFWAVSVTDALQAVLMLLVAVLLPLLAWQAVFAQAELPDFGVTSYWQLLGGETGWFAVGMLLGLLSIGFGPIGQPHLLNRIMAMADRRDIVLARIIALLWFVVVLSGMFLLGLAAQVLLNAGSGAPEQVFFAMTAQLLPSALSGIFIAAVLAAIMSTADSQLLVAGAAMQYDLQAGQPRGHSAQGTGSALARLAVCLVAGAATLLALYLPESIFARVLFAWNALGATFGPVVLMRMLDWRVADWSVPLAMGLGFVLTVLFYGLDNGPGDLWERALPFVTAFVTLYLARASR